jgi:hypothetical protein
VRHAQGFHRKERGSPSVPTLLTKEAEKVKQKPSAHDIRSALSEEYGPGGWTDEQQQIRIVIVQLEVKDGR